MECKIKITIDNSQSKAFARAIKTAIEDKIGSKGRGYGEIQDEVLDDMCVDDDIVFSDIGIEIHTEWNHPYI